MIREVARPGQLVKLPHLMDLRRVNGIGQKIVSWRKDASSDFV